MDSPPAVRATRSRRPTAKAASALEEQVSKPRRRTKAEKARDDKAEETRKKRENEMKQGSIEQVAQLEENMELVDAGAMSAHPRHRDDLNKERTEPTDREKQPKQRGERSKAATVGPRQSRGTASATEVVKTGFTYTPNPSLHTQAAPVATGDLTEPELTPVIKNKRAIKRTMAMSRIPKQTDIEEDDGSGDLTEREMPAPQKKKDNIPPRARKQVLAVQVDESEDGESTEREDNRTLTKVPKFNNKRPKGNSNNEPSSEGEKEDDDYEGDTELDTDDLPEDEETPVRKKIKVAKVPLREAVKAMRAKPAENVKNNTRGRNDISNLHSQNNVGLIQEWASEVLNAPKSKQAAGTHSTTSRSTTAVSRSKSRSGQTAASSHSKPRSGQTAASADPKPQSGQTAVSSRSKPRSEQIAASAHSQARTTSSSSTAIIRKTVPLPKKKIPSVTKKRDENEDMEFEGPKEEDAGYGGFADEDESAERQAALSSPVKGKQTLTSKSLVNIEPASSAPVTTRRSTPTNKDLPPGALEKWGAIIVPTIKAFIGSRLDIWSVNDEDAAAGYQTIWNYVFGAVIPYEFTPRSKVFGLVVQRISEWRSIIGSTAIAIVQAFFDSSKKLKTDEARQAYAKDVLVELDFIYSEVTINKRGKMKRRGAFFGPLILQTFAAHLVAIRGARTIPHMEPQQPIGALAMAAVAVERAFYLWSVGGITCKSSANNPNSPIIPQINPSTGVVSTRSTSFDHATWSKKTLGYITAIQNNLNANAFERLVEAATPYAVARAGSAESKTSTSNSESFKHANITNDPSSSPEPEVRDDNLSNYMEIDEVNEEIDMELYEDVDEQAEYSD